MKQYNRGNLMFSRLTSHFDILNAIFFGVKRLITMHEISKEGIIILSWTIDINLMKYTGVTHKMKENKRKNLCFFAIRFIWLSAKFGTTCNLTYKCQCFWYFSIKKCCTTSHWQCQLGPSNRSATYPLNVL